MKSPFVKIINRGDPLSEIRIRHIRDNTYGLINTTLNYEDCIPVDTLADLERIIIGLEGVEVPYKICYDIDDLGLVITMASSLISMNSRRTAGDVVLVNPVTYEEYFKNKSPKNMTMIEVEPEEIGNWTRVAFLQGTFNVFISDLVPENECIVAYSGSSINVSGLTGIATFVVDNIQNVYYMNLNDDLNNANNKIAKIKLKFE